jgi:hypothetical protein
MTAHQRNAVLPEAFREVARLRHVGDEQVGVAEIIGDVSDRHLDADKASRRITGRSFVPWAMPKGRVSKPPAEPRTASR